MLLEDIVHLSAMMITSRDLSTREVTLEVSPCFDINSIAKGMTQ